MHNPGLNASLTQGTGIGGTDEHPSLEQEARMECSTEHGVLGPQVCIEKYN
jgi:hypothetical protein